MNSKTPRKVAVITGASAGFGRAMALEMAKKGYDIAVLSRDKARLGSLKKAVEQNGQKALPVNVDVADHEQVFKAAETVEKKLGPIEVWINSAMATVFSPVWEMDPAEFKRSTEVTYLGTVYGTMAALRHMRPRNRGTIIEIGSALAHRSIPLQSAYCGAKHAILGFVESLRSELIHEKSDIHVSMAQLPAMNTPQFDWSRSHMKHKAQPVPPIYQPELVAEAVGRLVDNPRRELYFGANTFLAIWGNRVLPGFMDRYMAKNAWGSQLSQKLDRRRNDNLFETVHGDEDAHGRFDHRSLSSSKQLWLMKHGRQLAGLAAVVAAAGTALLAGRQRRRQDD